MAGDYTLAMTPSNMRTSVQWQIQHYVVNVQARLGTVQYKSLL